MLLRARRFGVLAARALRAGRIGTVRAAFARSFYLTIGDHWLCAGPPELGQGPLNVICDAWPAPPPIGAAVEIGLAGAEVWNPKPPAGWSVETLRRGLAAFDDALPQALPQEGLALLLRPSDALPPVARVAQAAVGAEDYAALLGLGPGLTPSGDDFLGGAMIALHYAGSTARRDALWSALEPHAERRTSSISFAHLAAAAQGFPGAALHDLLVALMTGDTNDMPALIARIDAIGHTSGWDAAAGAVLTLHELSA